MVEYIVSMLNTEHVKKVRRDAYEEQSEYACEEPWIREATAYAEDSYSLVIVTMHGLIGILSVAGIPEAKRAEKGISIRKALDLVYTDRPVIALLTPALDRLNLTVHMRSGTAIDLSAAQISRMVATREYLVEDRVKEALVFVATPKIPGIRVLFKF